MHNFSIIWPQWCVLIFALFIIILGLFTAEKCKQRTQKKSIGAIGAYLNILKQDRSFHTFYSSTHFISETQFLFRIYTLCSVYPEKKLSFRIYTCSVYNLFLDTKRYWQFPDIEQWFISVIVQEKNTCHHIIQFLRVKPNYRL